MLPDGCEGLATGDRGDRLDVLGGVEDEPETGGHERLIVDHHGPDHVRGPLYVVTSPTL